MAAAAAHYLSTEPQAAKEIVFFLSFQPVCVFFCIKKGQNSRLHNLSFKLFQAIQTANFYEKDASKMFTSNLFMFLDLQVSSDPNPNES